MTQSSTLEVKHEFSGKINFPLLRSDLSQINQEEIKVSLHLSQGSIVTSIDFQKIGQILVENSNINSLHLGFAEIHRKDGLPYLVNFIGSSWVAASFGKYITKCIDLEEFSISFPREINYYGNSSSNATDDYVKQISHFTSLKALKLHGENQVGRGDVIAKSIENNPFLETFEVKITEGSINVADYYPSYFPVSYVTAYLKEFFYGKEYIYRDKRGFDDVEKIFKALISFSDNLTTLVLEKCGIWDDGARYCAELLSQKRNMKTVSLKNNYISYRGAEVILDSVTDNHSLEALDLSYNLYDSSKPRGFKPSKPICYDKKYKDVKTILSKNRIKGLLNKLDTIYVSDEDISPSINREALIKSIEKEAASYQTHTFVFTEYLSRNLYENALEIYSLCKEKSEFLELFSIVLINPSPELDNPESVEIYERFIKQIFTRTPNFTDNLCYLLESGYTSQIQICHAKALMKYLSQRIVEENFLKEIKTFFETSFSEKDELESIYKQIVQKNTLNQQVIIKIKEGHFEEAISIAEEDDLIFTLNILLYLNEHNIPDPQILPELNQEKEIASADKYRYYVAFIEKVFHDSLRPMEIRRFCLDNLDNLSKPILKLLIGKINISYPYFTYIVENLEEYQVSCELTGDYGNKTHFIKFHKDSAYTIAKQGQYQDALAHCMELLKYNTKSADSYNTLGNILEYRVNSYDESVIAYKKAFEIDPHPTIANNIVKMLVTLCKFDELEKFLDEYQQLTNYTRRDDLDIYLEFPQDAYAVYGRIPINMLNLLMMKAELAIINEDYQKALRIYSQFIPSHEKFVDGKEREVEDNLFTQTLNFDRCSRAHHENGDSFFSCLINIIKCYIALRNIEDAKAYCKVSKMYLDGRVVYKEESFDKYYEIDELQKSIEAIAPALAGETLEELY